MNVQKLIWHKAIVDNKWRACIIAPVFISTWCPLSLPNSIESSFTNHGNASMSKGHGTGAIYIMFEFSGNMLRNEVSLVRVFESIAKLKEIWRFLRGNTLHAIWIEHGDCVFN